MVESCCAIPSPRQLSTTAHACNPGTQVRQDNRAFKIILGHRSEFEVSLGNMRACLRKKKKIKYPSGILILTQGFKVNASRKPKL